MSKYTTYELKIQPKYHNDVYRIMTIDGNKTLDNLSNEILSAFDFSNDHLYMFSLKRKMYDPEGYYHPYEKTGKRADKSNLNELNLKLRNKFLFLYDFGDEWVFDITVKKIEQGDIVSLTYVKEQKGEIVQYPDWEEEWDDDDDGDDDDDDGDNEEYDDDMDEEIVFIKCNKGMSELLSYRKPSQLKTSMNILGIKIPKVTKKASNRYAEEIVRFLLSNKERLLDLLTPGSAYLMLYMADDNNAAVPHEFAEDLSLDVLFNLGLVDISDEFESPTIETTKELYEFAEFFSDPERKDAINKSSEWQRIILALLNVYGVADLEFLHQTLSSYLKDEIEFKILEKRVFVPLFAWRGMDVFIRENRIVATMFDEEDTERILFEQNDYDVADYKKFEAEELSNIFTEGMIDIVPSLEGLVEYLVLDKELDPVDVAVLLTELSSLCVLGIDEDIITELFKEALKEFSLPLTKKVKNMISNVILGHPCSLLKGYSWNEYYNRNKAIDNQISMFDDE